MSESNIHKRAKRRAAGKSGRVEKPLPGNRRLDAATRNRATEVELSGKFLAAARRLKSSRLKQKVMVVRHHDMTDAAEAMRKVGVGGTVKNLSGTKRRSVPKPKRR